MATFFIITTILNLVYNTLVQMKNITTRKILVCIFAVMLLYSFNHSQHSNSNLDFTGMDEFWKISESLLNNIEPEKKDWDALFSTPGYSILTESEFSETYFKNYFRLAYMPQKRDSLTEELKKSNWHIQYLDHMTKVLSKKTEIQNQQNKLLKSNFLTYEALELAKDYLPENALSSGDLPPISFVIFGNDARGYSSIVIDLLFSIEQDKLLKYLIGHEAHHFYRNKILTFNFPDQHHPDYNLIWVLNQIQAEGIADQIDKKVRFFDGGDLANSDWALKYKELLEDTPNYLRKMDSLFVQYNDELGDLKSISSDLRKSIPMSGHTTGYYMANVIIVEIGKKELIKNIGNPFGFIKLYNQAASNHNKKYPVFSDKALELINKLETKYSKTNIGL